MEERIKGVERVPDGHYKFTVVGRPEKIKLEGGYAKRIWTLSWLDELDNLHKRKFHLFPSDYYPVVLSIGGKKDGSDTVWDDEKVDEKSFECDLKSISSKDGKYMNYKFENCEESIPF